MYKLYLDSSGAILTVVITKDNQILDSYSKNAYQQQTELALKTIDEILRKIKLSLQEIEKIIITSGPGSYTAVRVGITFARTLVALNPNIKIYSISTLLLQVGLKKAISIITGHSNKSYLAVYNQGEELINPQIVSEIAKNGIINDLKKEKYEIIVDFQNIDVISNFLLLETKAKKIVKLEDLHALYIGSNFIN